MNLWRTILKSLRQHALATWVTAFSIALAGGLLMSVWMLRDQARESFTRVNAGYDAVLGARGSKLQLVLNAVFHLEASPGNMAWEDYLEVKNNPNVEAAIPLAVGDNYRGYRLAGTMPEIFNQPYAEDREYEILPGGRPFDPTLREAVVGHFAARQLKLSVGDKFHPYHGLIFDETKQHSETYLVVGILAPSGTPADRVIWIPLAGLQKMSGHDPKAATALSAVLVKLKSGSANAGFLMDMMYNKQGDRLTFAWPIGGIIAQLFDKISWFDRVLSYVAYLVMAVAIGSVLASIYNTISERRRELAILRALGASRARIFAGVVGESAVIGAVGMMLGFFIYLILFTIAAQVLRYKAGVLLDPLAFHPVLLVAPLGVIGGSALAGFLPAWKAYRTDVASNLAPQT